MSISTSTATTATEPTIANQNKLALYGGPKLINNHIFKPHNPIGEEEKRAVLEVMDSGVLSKYLGAKSKDFYGGPKVLEFEAELARYFKVKHAITVNSWTSGLIAAVGAIGVAPGDEIIVSPWTMCASATAILHWNAIPVFADIEPETFCIDVNSIKSKITNRTKAILAIDIFGHSADMDAIREIADQYDLKVISDTAQAPGALYKGKFAGTIADIGGYSLNYHKHIHTGEGGVLVTDDDSLAERLKLIRNHAEAVVNNNSVKDLNNMLGYNFRLGEIECAIGIEQLKKLNNIIHQKQSIAEQLNKGLSNLEGLSIPIVKSDCTHVYYLYPLVVDADKLGVTRDKIVQALQAEGVPGIAAGYQNIHLLPIFQEQVAYGGTSFPWSLSEHKINYSKGICPVAEKLHSETLFYLGVCIFDFTVDEIALIIKAFHKVWENMNLLKV